MPGLVLHVLCLGEREEEVERERRGGKGGRQGERRERERGGESAEADVHLTTTPKT